MFIIIVIDRRVGSGRFGRTVLTNSGFGRFWQRISETELFGDPFFPIFLRGKVYFFLIRSRVKTIIK